MHIVSRLQASLGLMLLLSNFSQAVSDKVRPKSSNEKRSDGIDLEPSIEIRAILVDCPNTERESCNRVDSFSKNISSGRSLAILQFQGYDRDEPVYHTEVKNCRKKILITMKINNFGKTRCDEDFILVDHVYDHVSQQKARLLNPLVFKVRQEQVLQMYSLRFLHVVNGEATEEVINKQNANYTGCDDTSSNPTCGFAYYKDSMVPYSQGFCCSCDAMVNAQRQPPSNPLHPIIFPKGDTENRRNNSYGARKHQEPENPCKTGNRESPDEDRHRSRNSAKVRPTSKENKPSKRSKRSAENFRDFSKELDLYNLNDAYAESGMASGGNVITHRTVVRKKRRRNYNYFPNKRRRRIRIANIPKRYRAHESDSEYYGDRMKGYWINSPDDKEMNDFASLMPRYLHSGLIFSNKSILNDKNHRRFFCGKYENNDGSCLLSRHERFEPYKTQVNFAHFKTYHDYVPPLPFNYLSNVPLEPAKGFMYKWDPLKGYCKDDTIENTNNTVIEHEPPPVLEERKYTCERSEGALVGKNLFPHCILKTKYHFRNNATNHFHNNCIVDSANNYESELSRFRHEDGSYKPLTNFICHCKKKLRRNIPVKKKKKPICSCPCKCTCTCPNSTSLRGSKLKASQLPEKSSFESECEVKEHANKLLTMLQESNRAQIGPTDNANTYQSKIKNGSYNSSVSITKEKSNQAIENPNSGNNLPSTTNTNILADTNINQTNPQNNNATGINDLKTQNNKNRNNSAPMSSQKKTNQQDNIENKNISEKVNSGSNSNKSKPQSVDMEDSQTSLPDNSGTNSNKIPSQPINMKKGSGRPKGGNRHLPLSEGEYYVTDNAGFIPNLHDPHISSFEGTEFSSSPIRDPAYSSENKFLKLLSGGAAMPQIIFPIKQSSDMINFVNGIPVIMKPPLIAYPLDPRSFSPSLGNISHTGLSEGEQHFYNMRKKKSSKTTRSSKSGRTLGIVDLNSLRNLNKEVYNLSPVHGIPDGNDYQYVEMDDISPYYGTDDDLKNVKRKERSERNTKRIKRETISEVKDSAKSEVIGDYGTVTRERISDISNEARVGRTVPKVDADFKFNTRTDTNNKRDTFNTKNINSWMNTCRLRRQVLSNGLQVRGGQDCADRSTPPNADPRTYHESAHCLRFSDLWYTVYRVREPVTEHAVHIQLFEKHSLVDGTVYWRDLTRGNTVSLGFFQRHVKDELPTLSFKYSSVKSIVTGPFSLDPETARILIPQPVPPSKVEMYPQLQGGPNEYLVVDNEEISFDGEECDKAGVGFEAFVKQPDRCAKPKGTCLKNQPVHFWRSDIEARVAGRKGRYFLENYGIVPRKPVKTNYTSDETFLALEYQGKHTSLIDVELKADFNAVVRLGSSARITGVIVDSTNPDTTVISIMVTNLGLASSAYKVRMDDCPSDAPPTWSKQESHLLTIPPQQCHVFHLQLSGVCGLERVYCSLEVVNHHHELVATRRIRIQRNDRCFCLWHCLCACIGSVNGLQCEPMTSEHYHASGFRGSLPICTTQGPLFFIYDFWFNVLIFGLSMLFVMLFLGFLKALCGLCCPIVGAWGLGMLIDPRTQDRYYESHLAHRKVVYDEEGYPVHPDTYERTVRMTSKTGEFCLNLIFFLAFPFVILTALCRRCCNRSPYDCDAEAGTCFWWTNSSREQRDYRKVECPCPYDSEEEDTKYVMGELQRSRESRPTTPWRRQERKRSEEWSPLLDDNQCQEGVRERCMALVKRLHDVHVVYRNLTEPIGGVLYKRGLTYSIRGFFIETNIGYPSAPMYKFLTSIPLKQFWVVRDGEIQEVVPPRLLQADVFEVNYESVEQVYQENELSELPRGLCINTRMQACTEEPHI